MYNTSKLKILAQRLKIPVTLDGQMAIVIMVDLHLD